MASRPEMRMPYGPGWEDPDWTPNAPAPAQDPVDRRTRVASLSQFMAVVKRAATGRLWRSRPGLAPVERRFPLPGSPALVGPTRRWVIAGGAGLLAISSLPPMPGDTKAAAASMPDDETASGDDTPRRRA